MKRVIIGEKCIGCGICLHNKKYIEETTDGIARAIPGMMVTDKDIPDLEEIERICPIHELHLSPLKKETADSRVLSESKDLIQGINEGISKDIKFDDMFKKVFDTYERDMKHAIDEKIKELEKK
ncbi:ferredoxin [Dialister hominis]|jgi:ferredoxin|uniref:ferredoxin n=1 Tax=Dialister TaxID=39948 RepID=UPI003FF0520D